MRSRELESNQTEGSELWSLLTLIRKTVVDKLVNSLPLSFENLITEKDEKDSKDGQDSKEEAIGNVERVRLEILKN